MQTSHLHFLLNTSKDINLPTLKYYGISLNPLYYLLLHNPILVQHSQQKLIIVILITISHSPSVKLFMQGYIKKVRSLWAPPSSLI